MVRVPSLTQCLNRWFNHGYRISPRSNDRVIPQAERQLVITCLACLNTSAEILKSRNRPITSETLFRAAHQLENWAWRGLREESPTEQEEE